MEPVLTNLEKTSDDIKIFKVDVDLHEALANQFGLHSVPTLILFENGKELRRVSGFQSQVALEKFIK